METLDGIIFIYSATTQQWNACHRDDINDLWNNFSSSNILRSYHFETLRDIIIKYKGNINKINLEYK